MARCIVIKRKCAAVDDVGATGVYPCVLVECQRRQIDEQPLLYPVTATSGTWPYSIGVNELSRLDVLAQPPSRSDLRCGDVKVLVTLDRYSRG